MGVIVSKVVRHTRNPRVHIRTAQFFRRDFRPRCRLHQRRTADKNRPRPLHNHGLIGHRRHISPPRRAASHHYGNLWNSRCAQPRLIVKNPPKMVFIRKSSRLFRKKNPARINQIHAGQAIFHRNFLRPQVLFDRHRKVRAALDRRIIGHHQHFLPMHHSHARDHSRRRSFVAVHPVGGKSRKLQKRRVRIEQLFQSLPHRQFTPFPVPFDTLRRSAPPDSGHPNARANPQSTCACSRRWP